MIEDVQLRGLAERTQNAYVRAVRRLAEHYGRSPDQINEEELRQYLLCLRTAEAFLAASLSLLRVDSSSYTTGPCTVIGPGSNSR